MNISYVSALSACLLLGSCSIAGEWIEPDPEELEGSHLHDAGPSTTIDLGPDEKTLLQRLVTLTEENIKLRQSYDALKAEGKGLEASLVQSRNDVSRERNLKDQAEADSDMQRKSKRALEAKVLSLSITNAKLEQENLMLQIVETERALYELRSAPPMEAAAPPRIRR